MPIFAIFLLYFSSAALAEVPPSQGASRTGPGEEIVFIEAKGRLVIEAENFARTIARRPENMQQVHHWSLQTDRENYSGEGFMLIHPDEYPEDDHGPSSPRYNSGAEMIYNIRVSTPGNYHIWVRGMSLGGESNGVHVGIDGQLPKMGPGSNMSGFRPHKQWVWEHKHKEYAAAPIIEIPAGEHTLHIWQRDDAFRIDKVLLEIDRTEAPKGTGPKESKREKSDRS